MNLSLGPLGQISRSVKDITQSETWYKTVLGLPHLFTFGNLAFFDCRGVRLFLSQEEAWHAESILYLKIPDIQQAFAELKSRGVEFVDQPHMIHRHPDGTEEWMTFFKDLEGRLLALMAQVKPAS